MSDETPDPRSEPVRTAEVTVAAYQWDQWRASAVSAVERARRVAAVAAIGVGLVVGVVGLVWLPGTAKFSVALYTPLVAWAAWTVTRTWMAGRRLGSAVHGLRTLVVPPLLDTVDTANLVSLLRNGGTLVTARSTVIVAERRESLVALVASQYDVSHVPLNIPTGGFGP
ncbi:hypothetical protein [Aeromicrobium endophyticum]|uniref:Uncharacterized protein n=1 Tax=Aeromicrobium endophyticum TaxID=2292704 RepID=A0A371P4T9_9ACTN|nr:hypothetical protein [Aeromicrobium endophyticum]REK70550.1 hypothetical protein DX116_15620 [Aeromicrobium endophyticum]